MQPYSHHHVECTDPNENPQAQDNFIPTKQTTRYVNRRPRLATAATTAEEQKKRAHAAATDVLFQAGLARAKKAKETDGATARAVDEGAEQQSDEDM